MDGLEGRMWHINLKHELSVLRSRATKRRSRKVVTFFLLAPIRIGSCWSSLSSTSALNVGREGCLLFSPHHSSSFPKTEVANWVGLQALTRPINHSCDRHPISSISSGWLHEPVEGLTSEGRFSALLLSLFTHMYILHRFGCHIFRFTYFMKLIRKSEVQDLYFGFGVARY